MLLGKNIVIFFMYRYMWCVFQKSYHPGSLDLNTVNEAILLDLAKQAARIHRVSTEQVLYIMSCERKIKDF